MSQLYFILCEMSSRGVDRVFEGPLVWQSTWKIKKGGKRKEKRSRVRTGLWGYRIFKCRPELLICSELLRTLLKTCSEGTSLVVISETAQTRSGGKGIGKWQAMDYLRKTRRWNWGRIEYENGDLGMHGDRRWATGSSLCVKWVGEYAWKVEWVSSRGGEVREIGKAGYRKRGRESEKRGRDREDFFAKIAG